MPQHQEPTTPQGPFVAVSIRRDGEGNDVWSVIGGSAEKLDLAGARTLALCIITVRSAGYRSTAYGAGDRQSTGTTEDAQIRYIDVATGAVVSEEKLEGKDLPKRTTSTPHYTLSRRELVDQIVRDMTPPFTLSPEGEITGGKIDRDMNSGRP